MADGIFLRSPDIQDHDLFLLCPQRIELGDVHILEFLRRDGYRGGRLGGQLIGSANIRIDRATKC